METNICCSQRAEILAHFVQGKSFSREARLHYMSCEECIAAVTAELCKNLQGTTKTNGKIGADHKAANAALANGRAVLQREFGIDSDDMRDSINVDAGVPEVAGS